MVVLCDACTGLVDGESVYIPQNTMASAKLLSGTVKIKYGGEWVSINSSFCKTVSAETLEETALILEYQEKAKKFGKVLFVQEANCSSPVFLFEDELAEEPDKEELTMRELLSPLLFGEFSNVHAKAFMLLRNSGIYNYVNMSNTDTLLFTSKYFAYQQFLKEKLGKRG